MREVGVRGVENHYVSADHLPFTMFLNCGSFKIFPLLLLPPGTVSGLQLFLVLMLYVWLGIGLVCAGFCCQQVLLVARGQTWCQMRRGQLQENHSPWQANLKDVFGTRWILGLILPVQTVETCTEDVDVHKQD